MLVICICFPFTLSHVSAGQIHSGRRGEATANGHRELRPSASIHQHRPTAVRPLCNAVCSPRSADAASVRRAVTVIAASSASAGAQNSMLPDPNEPTASSSSGSSSSSDQRIGSSRLPKVTQGLFTYPTNERDTISGAWDALMRWSKVWR